MLNPSGSLGFMLSLWNSFKSKRDLGISIEEFERCRAEFNALPPNKKEPVGMLLGGSLRREGLDWMLIDVSFIERDWVSGQYSIKPKYEKAIRRIVGHWHPSSKQ